MRSFNHWQDWCNLYLAFWLFASPRLFEYSDAPVAAWNAYVVADVVAVLSIAAMAKFAQWEEWINALVGLGLIASPWLVGYTEIAAATWNHAIVGVLIVALSGWELAATPPGISTSRDSYD
jgi:hypothetical protein